MIRSRRAQQRFRVVQSQTGVTEASTTRMPSAGQFRHRHEVFRHRPFRCRTRQSRDVVGTCFDHHNSRVERNHILAEADQHLRRGLSAIRDSGGLPGKTVPSLRNLVAEKQLIDAWCNGTPRGSTSIARQAAPVVRRLEKHPAESQVVASSISTRSSTACCRTY